RGELDGRKRILDLVGDAAGHFLPGGRFLGAKNFREVVEDQHEAGVGFARAQGTDGNGEMEDAAASHELNFARNDAHTQRAPHQVLEDAAGFGPEEEFGGTKVTRGHPEHLVDGGVGAQDIAVGVEGDDAGGNVLEDGFHQLAASLEFLNGLLEVAGELVNLGAVVAQLRGHSVEGADQPAELVLDLFRNLKLEITGGNFARALGEGLNGHSDLLCEEQGDPGGGGENEHGKEKENQKHLALESAQVLLHFLVFLRLRLDGVPVPQEVRAGPIGGYECAG